MNRKLAKLNNDFCNKAVELRNKIEVSFLVLGKMLKKIRDERMFEPNNADFREFCEAEMKMSESKASRLVGIYSTFVETYKIASTQVAKANWSVLAETLPVIKTKADAVAWLDKARTLTEGDLRKELKELKTGLPMAKCAHPNAYLVSVCPDCGDRWRVYDQEK